MEAEMSGRTTINITDYTAYGDATLDDDLFNISVGATLALLGADQLNDDAVSGSGRVSVGEETTVDDRLLLSGATLFANLSELTQNGATFDLGLSSSDTVLARNVAGATWSLVDGASIIGAGSSEYVNLGLFDQIDGNSTIDANFYDRGGTIEVDGTLDFASPGDVNRFVNDRIEGAGTFEVDDLGVLDGSSVSTLTTDLVDAVIVGNVQVSSQVVDIGEIKLRAGSVLTLTNSAATVALGELVGAGEFVLRGNDTVTTNSAALLVGDVTFVNYGDMTVYNNEGLITKPWADDQITIENAAGATWDDIGRLYSPSGMFASQGAGSTVFVNDGTFEEEGYGATFSMAVVNNGTMGQGGNTAAGLPYLGGAPGLNFDDAVTGSGTIDIGGVTTLNNSVASGQTLEFNVVAVAAITPTLILDDPQGFAGTITGFDQPGLVDGQLVVYTATRTYQDFVANSGGTGGSLMFTNGSAETAVNLTGSYDPLGFHAAVSGSTTTITYTG
jgi:hypothetical protein